MSNHSMGFLLYDIPEKELFLRFSEDLHVWGPCERQIISSEMRTTIKQVASCILNKEKPFTLTSSFFNLVG